MSFVGDIMERKQTFCIAYFNNLLKNFFAGIFIAVDTSNIYKLCLSIVKNYIITDYTYVFRKARIIAY